MTTETYSQPRSTDDAPFQVDVAAVVAAQSQVDTAADALADAENRLGAAEDALADAEDEIGVAEAKAEYYAADATKKLWQLTAAQRDVAKRTRARDRAQKNVNKAKSVVHDAQLAVDDARAQLRIAMATPAPPEPEEPRLYYGSTDEFVREYLRYVYSRSIDGSTRVWASEWWRYDEAVIRLEALWRSWEHLRLDAATGMSVWFRDHADHHMAVLLSSDGPFKAAKVFDEENKAEAGDPLPYTAPPEGMFPDERPATEVEQATARHDNEEDSAHG